MVLALNGGRGASSLMFEESETAIMPAHFEMLSSFEITPVLSSQGDVCGHGLVPL